jgi:hypothetical protein
MTGASMTLEHEADAELLRTVEDARRENPGLEQALERYREARREYDRVVHGGERPAALPATRPLVDGGPVPRSRSMTQRGRAT